MSDLRFVLRNLAKTPAFSCIVIATLALCIGANTAIFSVVHAVLLKPYPWPESEGLLYVYNSYPKMGLPKAGVAIPDYLDRRSGVHGFAESALYTSASLNLSGNAEPELIRGLEATPSLFATLRSSAALGRIFTEDDAKEGAAPTIVLSNGLWKSQFGSDAGIIGRTIRIDERPVTVIGVMPAGFYFPTPRTQAWIPYVFTEAQRSDNERGQEFSTMIARLNPGVALGSIQQELDAVQVQTASRLLNRKYFWKNSGFGGLAVGFLDENVANIRGMLWLIQVGAVAALLIGCANVASLLLARSLSRQKEFAIRAAMGASQAQMVRLLLTESLVLFVAGGLAGFLVARFGMDQLKIGILSKLPRASEIELDPFTFGFALLSAALTGLLFGTLPAWLASRSHSAAVTLKEAGSRGSAGRRTQKLRAALVVGEIALAMMLVATSGLLVKSFIVLEEVSPGFSPNGISTAMVPLTAQMYGDPRRLVEFAKAVVERIDATPGVISSGAANALPFTGSASASASYSSPDIVLPPDAPQPHSLVRSADPGYLKAFGLTLLQGRWFNDTDTAVSEEVAVVDRRLVDRYWKGQNPIGKRIVRYKNGNQEDATCTIIGVVANVKEQSLDESTVNETIYYPLSQRPIGGDSLIFVARTSMDPARLTASLRSAVHSVDPNLPIFDIATMDQRMEAAAQPRLAPMILLAAFGGLSVVLATLGVYGVLAYSVAQRTTEFGVRMALGSTPSGIAGLVLRSGGALIGIGLSLGFLGYLAVNRAVASLLFQTASTDPLMLAGALATLALVAIGACLLPALRATRIEPIEALRQN